MKKAKVNLDPQKLLGLRLYPDAGMGSKSGSKLGGKNGPKIGQTKTHKIGSKVGVKRPKIGAKIGTKVDIQ